MFLKVEFYFWLDFKFYFPHANNLSKCRNRFFILQPWCEWVSRLTNILCWGRKKTSAFLTPYTCCTPAVASSPGLCCHHCHLAAHTHCEDSAQSFLTVGCLLTLTSQLLPFCRAPCSTLIFHFLYSFVITSFCFLITYLMAISEGGKSALRFVIKTLVHHYMTSLA